MKKANSDLDDDRIMDLVQPFGTHTPIGIPIRKLFVDNFTDTTKYTELKNVFVKYGKLDGCYFIYNKEKQNNKYFLHKRNTNNCAFITFRDPNDALKARRDGCIKKIKLHNKDLRVLPAGYWYQSENVKNQHKQEAERESPVSKLNDDCLSHIFGFLPIRDRIKIERVCTKWRVVSLNSWHTCRRLNLISLLKSDQVDKCHSRFFINYDPSVRVYKPSLRKVLLRCGRFIISVSLPWYMREISRGMLALVIELCPNIQEIDITGVKNLSSAEIASLARSYSSLTSLKLGSSTDFCDNELKNLFQNNLGFKILEIDYNVKTNGSCLLFLPVTTEELVLKHCYWISPNNFSNAIQRLGKLKVLKIKNCLELRKCDLVLNNAEKISSLSLQRCFPSTNNITQMVNLTDLSLKDCSDLVTDWFLSNLITKCVNLITVKIDWCNEVTGKGVSDLFFLPKLQHLKLSYLSITDFIINRSCVPLKLKTLDCNKNFNLNEKSICDMIESAPCLEFLILGECVNMTDKVVEVAAKCVQMRTNGISLKLDVHGTSITSLVKRSHLLYVQKVQDSSES